MALFAITVSVPGEATWAQKQRRQFEQRLSGMSERDMMEMPSVRTTYGEEGAHWALVCAWTDVEAENPWSAVQIVAEITARILPEVHALAVALGISATIQDPDRERRRPLGA